MYENVFQQSVPLEGVRKYAADKCMRHTSIQDICAAPIVK
jgi:hypothetical protein